MESECFSIISARFARGSDLFLIFSQQHEHWKPISEPRTRSANLRNLFVENICFNLLSAQSSSVASFMTEWASLSRKYDFHLNCFSCYGRFKSDFFKWKTHVARRLNDFRRFYRCRCAREQEIRHRRWDGGKWQFQEDPECSLTHNQDQKRFKKFWILRWKWFQMAFLVMASPVATWN